MKKKILVVIGIIVIALSFNVNIKQGNNHKGQNLNLFSITPTAQATEKEWPLACRWYVDHCAWTNVRTTGCVDYACGPNPNQ